MSMEGILTYIFIVKLKFVLDSAHGFEAVETGSDKLTHLTASRPRGPAKRPPSQVFILNVRKYFSIFTKWELTSNILLVGCCNTCQNYINFVDKI